MFLEGSEIWMAIEWQTPIQRLLISYYGVGSTTEDDFELTERNGSIPWWGSLLDNSMETFLVHKAWLTTS